MSTARSEPTDQSAAESSANVDMEQIARDFACISQALSMYRNTYMNGRAMRAASKATAMRHRSAAFTAFQALRRLQAGIENPTGHPCPVDFEEDWRVFLAVPTQPLPR